MWGNIFGDITRYRWPSALPVFMPNGTSTALVCPHNTQSDLLTEQGLLNIPLPFPWLMQNVISYFCSIPHTNPYQCSHSASCLPLLGYPFSNPIPLPLPMCLPMVNLNTQSHLTFAKTKRRGPTAVSGTGLSHIVINSNSNAHFHCCGCGLCPVAEADTDAMPLLICRLRVQSHGPPHSWLLLNTATKSHTNAVPIAIAFTVPGPLLVRALGRWRCLSHCQRLWPMVNSITDFIHTFAKYNLQMPIPRLCTFPFLCCATLPWLSRLLRRALGGCQCRCSVWFYFKVTNISFINVCICIKPWLMVHLSCYYSMSNT